MINVLQMASVKGLPRINSFAILTLKGGEGHMFLNQMCSAAAIEVNTRVVRMGGKNSNKPDIRRKLERLSTGRAPLLELADKSPFRTCGRWCNCMLVSSLRLSTERTRPMGNRVALRDQISPKFSSTGIVLFWGARVLRAAVASHSL